MWGFFIALKCMVGESQFRSELVLQRMKYAKLNQNQDDR